MAAPRRYEQRRRAEAAEDTRRRILEAAAARLRSAPSRPVGLDAVASDAGVSRSTVYLAFGSRAGLFDAVAADALQRGGHRRLVEAVADADPAAAMRGGLRAGAAMYAADPDVFRALFSMCALGEDVTGGTIRRWERTRAIGVARLARRLSEQGLLGVDEQDGADLLWVLTSFEAYDLLRARRELGAAAAGDALVAAAERGLLG
jgi:AcrR family transcriptional regulator